MSSSCIVSVSFFLKSQSFIRLPVLCSSALRINELNVTPGTSSGFWNDRKIPRFARSSAAESVMSSPSKMILPLVTVYAGLPVTA